MNIMMINNMQHRPLCMTTYAEPYPKSDQFDGKLIHLAMGKTQPTCFWQYIHCYVLWLCAQLLGVLSCKAATANAVPGCSD